MAKGTAIRRAFCCRDGTWIPLEVLAHTSFFEKKVLEKFAQLSYTKDGCPFQTDKKEGKFLYDEQKRVMSC